MDKDMRKEYLKQRIAEIKKQLRWRQNTYREAFLLSFELTKLEEELNLLEGK